MSNAVELWNTLTRMVENDRAIATFTDHELAARLQSALADHDMTSREYSLIESLCARLERSNGGPCEPLDGESDPEYIKQRSEAIELLRDEIVTLWHKSDSKLELHEHLLMTWDQYKAWVER